MLKKVHKQKGKERDFVDGKRIYEGERKKGETESRGSVKIRRSILLKARYWRGS